MSDVAFKIGFASDWHAGYAAKCRNHPATGLNHRVRDGYLAIRETVTQVIEEEVDLFVHGGDEFHRSWPSVADIVWVRQQMDRLAAAGIPVVGNTGNHDASSERGKSPATSAVHDPDRGITMVTDPYLKIEPVEGLVVHMISHYGLAQAERLIPEPEDGKINILSAHGAAMVPGHEIFHCVDSPGEQPIGLDLLIDDRFQMKMLGHYHGMDEILDNVWYAGSAIRRGFSDPEGGRGWLLFNVHTDGSMTVERKYISQRAQYDLPRIDASGLTGAEVEEQIRANLTSVDLSEAIVRQVVTNCSTAIRRGIDQPALSKIAEDTLMWMPDLRRPEATADDGERTVEGVGASLKTAGSADLPKMYQGWISDYASQIDLAPELHTVVVTEGERHLRAASQDVEGGDFAAPDTAAVAVTDADTDEGPATLPVREPAGVAAYGVSPDTGPAAEIAPTGTDEEIPF